MSKFKTNKKNSFLCGIYSTLISAFLSLSLLGIFLTCETVILHTYSQNRVSALAEAAIISRNFQGLVLDGSGIGALILNAMEREKIFFVKSIKVHSGPHPGQTFLAHFPQSQVFRTLDYWPTRIRLDSKHTDLQISVELLLSTYACTIGIAIALIGTALGTLLRLRSKAMRIRNAKDEINKQIAEYATHVAHDIRSPLAALRAIQNELQTLPEETRLLASAAIGRISDIANNLLQTNSNNFQASSSQTGTANKKLPSPQPLLKLLAPLVSEKRLQYRPKHRIILDLNFDESASSIFAAVHPTEFQRALSNIIDNSVEALEDSGQVSIWLRKIGNYAHLVVADNGKGIPAKILPKLMQRGESHNKSGGSGLGLYHAKLSIEEWNGEICLSSTQGKGTSVDIRLPLAHAPT